MRTGARQAGRVLGLALAVALGCAGRPILPPPPDPSAMDRETYRIGVTDVLRIRVWKNPELSVDLAVRQDGKISVPLLDDVQAEGLEPMELKEIITEELSEYIANPQVTVIVAQNHSKFVSVMGGVRRTARVPLTRNLRVLEALITVGGFTTFADKSDVRIVRLQESGSEVEYRFDYDAYVGGKAPGTNITLQNGDVIIVPD